MKLIMIIMVSFLLPILSCLEQDNIGKQENIPISYQEDRKFAFSGTIDTKIEVFGWWWSESQLLNNFDADNPPLKKDYIKLENWNAGGANDYPHPNKVDIICKIKNEKSELMKLQVSGKVDFKIASYKELTNLKSEEEVEAKLQSYQWQNEKVVGKTNSIILQPGESKEIIFKDFDLRKILNTYLDSTDDRWAWKMRILFFIYNEKGQELSQGIKILDLIPAD